MSSRFSTHQRPDFLDQRHVPDAVALVRQPARHPDTSPIRAAVHAAKVTTSPQP
ncbi:hypothetical protein [Nocardia iowensis]|uniref:Uncharacterized protein n=1 Tax=Nocardia iowensis TaxID=204891 RepID=A0ABX8RZD8_NOCIO|nr:hypothetical protein [Nocardia iowensis]QXN94551.1 hypothetical protein KV110_16760 [Nocardia iowensis]